MGGRLIGIVGVSSAGKTSVSEELQRQLGEPYLHVGIDHFFSMFPYEWKGFPRQPGPGFWVDLTPDVDGSPRARIRYGDAGGRLLAGMRAAVNALLAAGNDVILDEMPIDATIMPAWRRDLRADEAYWVYLDAPLAVLEQRERGRPQRGRVLGNARGHLDIARGERYDLVLDVTGSAPGEIAGRIIEACPFAR